MPRLLSNRKPVLKPDNLKDDRWDYLNLQNAQPALGLAPVANEGFTLQSDENGKITWTNTLGGLEFENQTITAKVPDEDIVITGVDNGSNIILSPFQRLQINGDAVVTGDFTVQGNPLGTYPVNPQTLYVTPNGDDRNDGTALDASRACRTISGAVRSPFYVPGTTIKVAAGAYFEDNPIPLKPYTSVVGNDLRTTFVEPLNKDLDLFHVNSGVYIAQMQMRNLRRGEVERYAPGGAGTYTTGAYAVAFPPSLDNPIDIYYSPYIQNCTNQSGPWLKDGTMFVPNQTVQIPLGAGTSTWVANQSTITVTLYTGTVAVGMAVNDEANEGYRNAQLLLQRNKTFLQSQVVAWVDNEYPSLSYDKDLCYRDVGYIVDAVAGDARFGGNKRSIEAGLAYWSGVDSLIPGEINETANAIQYLKSISADVVINSATSVILYNTTTSQVIDLNLDKGAVVQTRIATSYDLITGIVVDGEAAVPDTVDDLLGLIYPTGLSPNQVNVASTVTAVNMIAPNTYEVTLNTPTVAASDDARIYFGYTTTYPYLDDAVPEEWKVSDGEQYADRRLDPTGSGGGALVDGNAPSERSPIQSFVFDAFTQLNQGGNGIHIINNGYAQLVSVFTIMCSNAVIVENGGIASITNSNSNFGDTCLTAKGLGKLAYQGFVKNPAYPTNVENGEYYPLGYWPQQQRMEVFLPNDLDRPHIGQVMEVVAPDTYINYEGVRVPYVNEAGYPGYLIATSNTGTITTGSYVISGIDVTNVAVGHTLYIRDVLGNETHPVTGQPYVTTGTQVVDVQYQTVILDRPILNGYADTNLNYFNLYFAGNAYYTVLSSQIDYSLASTVTNSATLVPGQETTTSLAVSYARDLALRVIQNVPITGYEYDKVKCARDTGIIVDTVVGDLMFSGTGPFTQANFAGLQYWNQDSYVGDISNEITTTTNAIAYVKELARNVVLGITTATPYQSTVTQNVSLPVASSVEATAIRNDFAVILDILENGTAGVTDDVIANGYDPVSANAQLAYNLLQANKTFLQAEAVAFVESTKQEGFVYDQEKCLRDIGYMVDSVAHDILYGGNRQAIQSGVFYYGFDATSSAIENQQVQTTAAYVRLKDIIPSIITNVAITPTVNNTLTQVVNLTTSSIEVSATTNQIIDLITDIITDGPIAAIEGLPIGQVRSTDVDVESAAAILLANKEFIKAEVTAYIDKYYGTGFVYDQAKCYRDTGLIVDAIATDLLYPTDEKSQSNFAGLQYWNQAGYTGSIAGELTTTTNALRYVRDLAAQVVQGINTGTRYQSTVTQNVASVFATESEATIVYNDFETIIDILVDGTAGVTDKIIPNGPQSTTSATIDAYTLLKNNKAYIQAEAVAYVEATKFTYDQDKCFRDSGLIVDAIALDLLYPTDTYSQSTFAGLQYWDQGGYTGGIEGELTTTTNAINYVNLLAQLVVQNSTAGTRYQSTVTQITNLPAASEAESILIDTEFSVIVDILTNGTAGVTDIIVPNNIAESTEPDVRNAYALLLANKPYIQAEAVAYVESTKTEGFEYDQELCYRDVGYMVDSVAFDLLHGGNKQAVQSGVYYYTFDANSTAIPNEKPQTVAAFNFIKELSQRLVLNVTGTNYQSTVTQITSLPGATPFEAELLGRAINTITNIIIDGPDIVTEKTPINLDASDNINKLNAALILEANREFIQAETVEFVNQTQQFVYDQELCYRDVGYMVDSVAFDLLHPLVEGTPSNRQAIQSGVYYYGFSDTSSAIAGEIPQTTQAYQYIRSLIPYIVTGQIAPAYQDFVTQTTSTSVATSNEINALYGNIDLIVNIINNGPTAANSKVPVSLNKDSDANVYNAYQLLMDNRQFIQEETIAYINENNKLGQYQSIKNQVFDLELTGGNRAIASLESKFDIISGIIKDGADSSPTIVKPRQYVDSDQGILNARRLLEKNRNFIQEEVVAYVDNLWPSKFSYDPVKCSRDTGLIVDALAQDLLFGGNSQSTFAGIQYWNQGTTLFPGEQTTTTNAVRYLKDIATKVITNDTTGYRYSTSTFIYNQAKCERDTGLIVDSIAFDLLYEGDTQSTFAGLQYWNQGGYTGDIAGQLTTTSNAIAYVRDVVVAIANTVSTAVSAELETNFNKIIYILNTGTDGVTDAIVPNGIASTNTDVITIYNAILANKSTIQTDTTDWIDATTTGTFAYNTATCQRDVGYIIDSVVFDMLHGGNRQSIMSGVYYYDFNAESTTIQNEIPQTTAAYNYIKSIVDDIIIGNQILNPYQDVVRQETDLPAGSAAEAGLAQDKIDIITDIIANGPGSYGTAPIALTASTSTDVVEAFNMLLANREFIVAETVAYLETEYNGVSTQIANTSTATTTVISKVQSGFDLIIDILENGTDRITDRIVPNSLDQSQTVAIRSAYEALQANKRLIQNEVVEYIDQTNSFVYDQAKCARDTGLIVDAIVLDMQYPSELDSQSTFAGLQYWNQDQYVGTIANEITTTTNAITYLSSIAQKVVVNNQSGTRYQSTVTQTTSTAVGTVSEAGVVGTNFGVILDILNTGTVGVTDIIVPNGRPSLSTATSNAYNLLLSNKEYLQAEVIAYIESTKEEGFEYDQTKCLRDVGYMIDSVAFDLLHGGNKQSVQSGVYYYGYDATSTAINYEIPQTTAAYNRIREIIPFIVQGLPITPSQGNTTDQIVYMLPATVAQATTLQSKIDRITNIINNGPSVAPELTPISLTADTNPLVDRAYDLMVANREFIKAEVIAYVNQQFTGFDYDRDKCFRDVGYMLDSVSFDLLYGGNKQAVQSGVYYYSYDAESTAIPKEIPQTTSAYNFIEQIVGSIVSSTPIIAPQQSVVPQVTSENSATDEEAQLVRDNVNLINNIIENGPNQVTVKEPIGLTESQDLRTRNAAYLLKANRDFIRAETIAFINNTYNTGFLYDKTKCQRDTGLIVDSIAFDLLYNGTTESTFAGLQYWNQDDYTGTVKAEITTTTNAIRYMKEIVGKVIVNTEVPVTVGNTATQVTTLTPGTAGIAKTVTDNVDIILNILANGTAGVTDIIVPNGKPLDRIDITTSYDVLQANKEFIQSEVIARIDYDNTEFEYDRTTCARDIGYIVDSISFDLLHGGNRQSVTSGVYYYGFNAADTAIDDQIPQTVAAYERIRDIVGSIVKGQAVDQTYQYKVKQEIGTNVATDAEVTELQDKIDNITNIINNGPDVAPVQQPISLVASTSTAVANAFDLLIANRNFIKAEVTAYIDAKYTDTPNYDRDKCYRDVGAIIDAVGYDLAYGGNYNSVNTGNGYFNRKGQYHIVRLEQNVTDPTLFIDGATVRFYQQSYISASGYLFEYVGAGTQYGALPQVGTADPNQGKEVVQLNNGKVFFTSTDQNGDFRIGPTLVISQSTGVLSGRTFQKSLYAEMTPFILVVGA